MLSCVFCFCSRNRDGAVIFVGMDTPELPWSEVMAAKSAAEKDGRAYICPGLFLFDTSCSERRRELQENHESEFVFGVLVVLWWASSSRSLSVLDSPPAWIERETCCESRLFLLGLD